MILTLEYHSVLPSIIHEEFQQGDPHFLKFTYRDELTVNFILKSRIKSYFYKNKVPKTRFIPFDVFDKEQLIDILEEQVIIANNNPNNCEHLLFCKKDGTYIIPSQINQIPKKYAEKWA